MLLDDTLFLAKDPSPDNEPPAPVREPSNKPAERDPAPRKAPAEDPDPHTPPLEDPPSTEVVRDPPAPGEKPGVIARTAAASARDEQTGPRRASHGDKRRTSASEPGSL